MPKFIFISFIIFLITSQTSCKKSVEVNPPDSGLVSASVYESNATAAASVTSIYTRMVSFTGFTSGTTSITFRAGLLADELKNYSTDETLIQFYKNNLNSATGLDTWSELYKYIYSANSAIEGLGASTKITEPLKSQLIGEAKFMRAFFYFYLTNQYGDVPLVTSTNYVLNNTVSRSNSSIVYDQIVADLKEAQTLLPGDYVDPAGQITEEKVRPNKWAATGLLARVYLYNQKWDSAENQASLVLGNLTYNLDTLNEVFLKNSNETIWQIQTVRPGGSNTLDAFNFILIIPPGQSPLLPVALSANLLGSFEPGDGRRANWIDSLADPSGTFYYPYKYKAGAFGYSGPVTEYLMVLRLAEQYLIRAEARAEQNNMNGALDDLNIIRERAGLLDYSGAGDQSSVLKAILHERQVELFTEWGHRWFDLKRTGNVDAVMSKVTPTKGGDWSPDDELLPIPQSEILINSNLTQNKGY